MGAPWGLLWAQRGRLSPTGARLGLPSGTEWRGARTHLLGDVRMAQVHVAARGSEDDALERGEARARDDARNVAEARLGVPRECEPRRARVRAQPPLEVDPAAGSRRKERGAAVRRAGGRRADPRRVRQRLGGGGRATRRREVRHRERSWHHRRLRVPRLREDVVALLEHVRELDQVGVVGGELHLGHVELLQVGVDLAQRRAQLAERRGQPLHPRRPVQRRRLAVLVGVGRQVGPPGRDLLADVAQAALDLVAVPHLRHEVALEGRRALVQVAEHHRARLAELLDRLRGRVGLHDHLDHHLWDGERKRAGGGTRGRGARVWRHERPRSAWYYRRRPPSTCARSRPRTPARATHHWLRAQERVAFPPQAANLREGDWIAAHGR